MSRILCTGLARNRYNCPLTLDILSKHVDPKDLDWLVFWMANWKRAHIRLPGALKQAHEQPDVVELFGASGSGKTIFVDQIIASLFNNSVELLADNQRAIAVPKENACGVAILSSCGLSVAKTRSRIKMFLMYGIGPVVVETNADPEMSSISAKLFDETLKCRRVNLVPGDWGIHARVFGSVIESERPEFFRFLLNI